MASVTFSASVGGDGSVVTDDTNPTTGLGAGGHRTRFVPALAQLVAVSQYVVNTAQGMSNGLFTPCRLSTTADHALSGLTAIDGVTPIANDRIFVPFQSTGSQNGIYIAAAGAWTRAADADANAEWIGGKCVTVQEGTLYGDTMWQVTNDGAITVGTTALTFQRRPSLALPNTWTGVQTFSALVTANAGITMGSGSKLALATGVTGGVDVGAGGKLQEIDQAIGSLTSGSMVLLSNAYYSSGWKKIATGWASALGIKDGKMYYYTSNAGAGSANDAITWVLSYTLTETGDVVLADVAPSSALSAGFGGVPIVTMDAATNFLATHARKCLRHTDTTAYAWTIQPFSTIPHPVGTVIAVRNFGTGAITLTRGAGVVLRSAGSSVDENKVLAQYAFGTLTQEAQDVWLYSGAL